MPYLNQATIVGHLAKDPETRFTTGGMAIANFSVYTRHGVKKDGKWEKETTFHDCIAFGKQAEWLGEARKGQLVILTGRIQKRKWQDKEGKDRYSVEIVCDSAQVMKDREETGAAGENQASTGGSSNYDDDDIPF